MRRYLMLKRIDCKDAEIGMFIERFEGSWFKHPFWKRRFILSDEAQLRVLRTSAASGLIIDIEKGTDTSPSPKQEASCATMPQRSLNPPSRSITAPAQLRYAPMVARGSQMPTSQRQFGNAKMVARECSKVVSQVFLKARLGKAVELREVEPVIEEIYRSITDNPYVLNAVLRCQNQATGVYRHALAVSSLMVALGRAMRLSPEKTKMAGLVGLFMDLGVGQMAEDIEKAGGDYLMLPRKTLEQHVFYGVDILAKIEGVPPDCVQACLDHHERIDGSGYPRGSSGEAIGQLAQMAGICDDFDYLVCSEQGIAALDPHDAIADLLSRWQEFDPEILRAFQKSTGLYPVGTFVELRSGRLAMVVDIDPDDPGVSIVRTIGSWTSRSMARQVTLNLGALYGQDGITGVAKPIGLTGNELQALRARTLEAAYRASAG